MVSRWAGRRVYVTPKTPGAAAQVSAKPKRYLALTQSSLAIVKSNFRY
jgi:hypothetical protein